LSEDFSDPNEFSGVQGSSQTTGVHFAKAGSLFVQVGWFNEQNKK